MCDWNRNGKYDWEDAFINYHIHRSISENKQEQSGPSSDDGSVITVIGVVLLVLGILIILT